MWKEEVILFLHLVGVSKGKARGSPMRTVGPGQRDVVEAFRLWSSYFAGSVTALGG
jgi:hypothetical protein